MEHGPLIWPTIEENGMTRTKKYAEFSSAEKIQADCDMKATNIILQDGLEDEEDTRSSQEYMYDLELEFHERALLAYSKRFFIKGKNGSLNLICFFLKSTQAKNKGLVVKAYEWDEEDVSSDDNEMVKVRVLMVLADDDKGCCGKGK
nr:hypothetical protein [Tanacetum cinerariifolium]